MTQSEIVFWLAIGVIAYTYAGYPLLIWLWSRCRKPHRKLDIEPNVSLLVVAQGEGGGLHRQIENLLALDYSPERREIVVACEGRGGDTAALARRYGKRGVRVLEAAGRRGRAALLNELVPALRGDVVVLVDAFQRLEARALRALVANFADPRTGAVSGVLAAEGSAAAPGVGEEYENFLRGSEARVHSTVCTTAALFALRKRLFRPLPEGARGEDLLISRDMVRQGFRVHHEPGARAYGGGAGEDEPPRHRRGPGDILQALRHECGCLNPVGNPLWLQNLSHKFLRLLGPLCLVAAFVANFFLLEHSGYRLLLGLQVLFYGAALAGVRLERKKASLLHIPCAICQLNWATVKGFAKLLPGRQEVTWKKAEG